MTGPVTRVQYFEHQFLHVDDFSLEQKYHLSMRREHNRSLHTWGIAEGLELTGPTGDSTATVNAGMAIDSQGREVVLPTPVQTPDVSDHKGKTVYVTICYGEVQAGPAAEGGITGYSRVEEQPEIHLVDELHPGDTGTKLVLGRLTINESGRISRVEPDGRRVAGATTGTLEVEDLALKHTRLGEQEWPRLQATAANQVELKGGLSITGGLSVQGTATLSGPLVVTHGEGIRQNNLRLSGGEKWQSIAFNAYHIDSKGPWYFPDKQRTGLTIEMDDGLVGGEARFEIYSTTTKNKGTLVPRLKLRGDTGDLSLSEGHLVLLTGSLAVPFAVVDGQVVEAGDLVMLAAGEVMRTTGADDRLGNTIGVVAGLALPKDDTGGRNMVAVTVHGRVRCKVNNSNGHVLSGDWLTASKDGAAVKAFGASPAAPGTLVAKAIETMPGGDRTTSIYVFVTLA